VSKTPIIQVKNLVKNYGKFNAVDGINFEVYAGEIFGLLGPNGAGKTTTLEIMETLRDETSGEVIIDGLSVNKPSDQKKIKNRIGVQLQTAGFYPGLNLKQLILLFGGLYNVKVSGKCDELLDRVNLCDKMNTKYEKLSGGQKQRFSIATTLIHKPKLIFLDEPTTGLDPQARRNLWQLIKDIKKEGVTVVITTHYMDEAEYLCDRVGVMDKGKILTIGTPHQLIDELLAKGFKREKATKLASLEDVFLDLTGHEIRDE
jgi:ABC-2 type transport system ATP-binding protein